MGIARGARARSLVSFTIEFLFGALSALALFLASCAAPGAPIARQPARAEGINDLSAKQSGNSVVLTFTSPKETTQGDPLNQAPEIKIYREFVPVTASGSANAGQPSAPEQLVLAVDPQTEKKYRNGDRLSIPVQLSAQDVSAHAGEKAMYMVRTRISARDSSDSNRAEVLILPAPPAIEDLRAQVTQSEIELSWRPVEISTAGTLGPATIRYRVYRTTDVPMSEPGEAAGKSSESGSELAFAPIGETSSPAFNDGNFPFGFTYEYRVRSIAHYDAGEVESEDSEPLKVTPRDTFPPAAPGGLVAASVPAVGGEPAHVDLSWNVSPEQDVAGYNVYRSEAETGPWQQMNSQPLPAPSFRDISVVARHRYLYRVTAVDRSGNESSPSPAVAVTLPGANDQEKP